MNDKLLTGVLIEEISFIDLCHKYDISKELLIEMIEEGLFTIHSSNPQQIILSQKTAHRIEAALRLHRDLNVNLPGVVLALELLEEMEELQQELAILRKHF